MASWEESIDRGVAEAKQEGKLVLVDFCNPQLLGCKQLDAVTWKDEKVGRVVQDWFVRVRINGETQKDRFKAYMVPWTPTIVILDAEGEEHYGFTGFLRPLEFNAAIILNGAKAELDLGKYKLAIKCCNEVIEKYKGSFAVPEAIFYLSRC